LLLAFGGPAPGFSVWTGTDTKARFQAETAVKSRTMGSSGSNKAPAPACSNKVPTPRASGMSGGPRRGAQGGCDQIARFQLVGLADCANGSFKPSNNPAKLNATTSFSGSGQSHQKEPCARRLHTDGRGTGAPSCHHQGRQACDFQKRTVLI